MSFTYHSPAEVIRQYLSEQGAGSLLTQKSEWPIYVSSLPDYNGCLNEIIAVYDTIGSTQGRIMKSGQYITKPGLQVRVRANKYNTGWRKILDISGLLEAVNNVLVTLVDSDGVNHIYKLNTLSRTSAPAPSGTESGSKRRDLFSVNYLVTLSELAVFSSQWDTTNEGSASDTIEIPMISKSSVFVDWGDGTLNNEVSHTYAEPGIKSIRILGEVTTFQFADAGDKEKILDVSSWGNFTLVSDAFRGCSNLDLSALDAPKVTATANRCFLQCSSLTGGLSHWDMSQAERLSNFFNACSVYSEDLNSWDTSRFENIEGMFASTPFNEDLSSWDTSKVKNMAGAFAFNVTFNQDISMWDVGNCSDFSSLFLFSSSFNQNLNNWDMSSAENMASMFVFAGQYNQPMDSWDISNATTLSGFASNTSLSQANYDLLLEAWSLLTLQPSVTADFGLTNFGPAGPSIARKLIKDTYSWVINDGGGTEIIANGDFLAGATNWTIGGTSIINAGVLQVSGIGPSGAIAVQDPAPSLNAGHTYTLSFEITDYTSGDIAAIIGGVLGDFQSGVGTKTETREAVGTTTGVLSGLTPFVGSITNISLKEL